MAWLCCIEVLPCFVRNDCGSRFGFLSGTSTGRLEDGTLLLGHTWMYLCKLQLLLNVGGD